MKRLSDIFFKNIPPVFLPHPGKRYIVDLDSTSSMLFGLSHYLKRDDSPSVGGTIFAPDFVSSMINSLPPRVSEGIYSWSGWWEAIPRKGIGKVRSDDIAEWMLYQYPGHRYSGAMIGSSNGAAVHLCAALGIPWLPQTFLLPVRRPLHPDEVASDLEWGKDPVLEFASQNPEIKVHQMHDPVQDRLMLEKMAYFRVKYSGLCQPYKDFLKSRLAPGSTLFIIDCRYSWPVTKVSREHVFQVGGLGETTPQEYLYGSERVEEFLRRKNSKYTRWLSPEPNSVMPEAEWGFLPELEDEVMEFAGDNGYAVCKVSFDHPEELSPFVSDLYAWWYRANGTDDRRLLMECFALLEPRWAVMTRSIPFWFAFNTESSRKTALSFVEKSGPFDEIFITLMANGLEGIGLATLSRWKEVLGKALRKGDFLGIDEARYPRDLASFIMYQLELQKKITPRYPEPPSLSLPQFRSFLESKGSNYPVKISFPA